MPDFLLPDLGEGLDEAEVVSWRVKPGDRVAVDQVIAEVETAKAVVEVPVPYAGTVAALHAEPGSVVSVGQPLITVTADEPAAFREPGVVTPSGDQDSGSVLVGYGTDLHAGTASARGRRGRGRGAAVAIPVDAPPADVPRPRRAAPVASAPATADRPGRVAVISPIVRKEAKDAGLDLTALTGTGPAGVISRRDVRRAIAEHTTRPQRPVPAFTPDVGGPDADAGARAAERRTQSRRGDGISRSG